MDIVWRYAAAKRPSETAHIFFFNTHCIAGMVYSLLSRTYIHISAEPNYKNCLCEIFQEAASRLPQERWWRRRSVAFSPVDWVVVFSKLEPTAKKESKRTAVRLTFFFVQVPNPFFGIRLIYACATISHSFLSGTGYRKLYQTCPPHHNLFTF